jgi:hypothetical protein
VQSLAEGIESLRGGNLRVAFGCGVSNNVQSIVVVPNQKKNQKHVNIQSLISGQHKSLNILSLKERDDHQKNKKQKEHDERTLTITQRQLMKQESPALVCGIELVRIAKFESHVFAAVML